MNNPPSFPRDFFLFSSALLCVLNAEGKILQVNPAWEKKLNLLNIYLEQSYFLDWVHPEDISLAQDNLTKLLIYQTEVTFVLRWRDQVGDYHWLTWEITPVPQQTKFYAVATDITEQKQAEQTLYDNQERFELAVQGSRHGLWDWNLLTNEIYLSPRWKNILGYQDYEIANQLEEWCRFVHPDDYPKMWSAIEAYLDQQIPYYESIYRMSHQDGSYLWILARAAALWDQNHQPYRMVGTYVDITEQKLLEQASQEKEALLAAIFEVTKIGLCIVDAEGRFVRVNPAYCQLFGYATQELLGHHFTTILPSDQQARAIQLHQAFLRGEPEVETAGEWQLHDKSGRLLELSFTMGLLVTTDQRFRVTTLTDITKRKQAEAALRQSEERLRMVTSAAPVILFAIDTQGIFTFSRGKALNLLDYQDDEVVGRSIFKMVSPHQIKQIRKVLAGETVINLTILPHVVLETKLTPLLNEYQQVVGAIGVSVDVTKRHHLEQQLKTAIDELETILDNSVIGIAYLREDKFVRVNRKLETLLGLAKDDSGHLSFSTLYPSPQQYQEMYQTAQLLFKQGQAYDHQHLLCTKTGQPFWARVVGKPVDAHKPTEGSIWIIEDITVQKQAEQHLRMTATIFESTAEGIFVTDLENRILQVNPAFTKITGYRAEEVYGKKTYCLSSGRHDQPFYQRMWESIQSTGHWRGEIWNRKKTGEVYVAWLSISTITNEAGQTVQYMAILTDISRLQEEMENVRYLASYDSLTRLPNRMLFHDSLLQAQEWAHRHNKLFALLFIDLDGFKPVNDNLGHAIGDQLLQGVAERLRGCVRETDTVARLGGDEFTIILKNIRRTQDASRVAADIVQRLQQPFQIAGHQIAVSASIGITVYPYDSKEIDILLKYADSAMYQAKGAGKGQFCFYRSVSI